MSIRLEHVSFSYGDTAVLQDVTWHLPSHGIVCLWGPSGCGKTTLLRLLAGLETPQSGNISTAHRVAMMFQEDRLLPWMTAVDNVAVSGVNASVARKWLLALGLTEEEMSSLPSHLSGGQQRRVALARALAAESDILLLDEPFNGLDKDMWQNVIPLIAAYAQHKPVVLVTHIREQAEALDAVFVPLQSTPLSGELKTENL